MSDSYEPISCLFIGTSVKDLLLLVDEPPQSDRRISASRVVTICGGPAATAAAAFCDLGGKAGLITAVGCDENAAFVADDVKAMGLASVQLITIPGTQTSFSAIQVEQNGKRCITHYGGCIDRLQPEMLDRGLLGRAAMVHLGGMNSDLTVRVSTRCRAYSKGTLSVDGGNLSREALDALSRTADILIPDDKTVMKTYGLAPEEACRLFCANGVKIACVTCGEKGCVAYDGSRMFTVSACGVDVLDTTGAGDNFHGAFAFALQNGYALEEALRFSNVYAALTCTGLGGRDAAPGLEKTKSLMKTFYSDDSQSTEKEL